MDKQNINGIINMTNRARPFAYNSAVPDDVKIGKETKMSFFSGHVSITAAATFFMASIYSEYHPHSRMKPLVGPWLRWYLLPWAG